MGYDGNDGTRSCRSHETGVGDGQGSDARHAAADGSEDEDGLHQDVREIDLVDSAQEVDDRSTGSRCPCSTTAEEHVGQQDAQAGAGVGFEQEQDGLALVQRLLDAQRCQYAVVDGVVQEEDLGRLDEDAGEGQQAVVHQELNHW